jgi:Family of unknown function (DUF6703)
MGQFPAYMLAWISYFNWHAPGWKWRRDATLNALCTPGTEMLGELATRRVLYREAVWCISSSQVLTERPATVTSNRPVRPQQRHPQRRNPQRHQPQRHQPDRGTPATPRPGGGRLAVERRSAAPLVFLRQLPAWVPPLVLAGLLVAGFALRGPAGAAALCVVAVFVGWLGYLSWPRLGAPGRAGRVAAVACVLALAVLQATR